MQTQKGLCIKCKGRLLCSLPRCPILTRHTQKRTLLENITDNAFSGSAPPGVFVSWKSYPKVSFSPLTPTSIVNNAGVLEQTEKWLHLPEERIISMREQLIQAKTMVQASSASNPSYRTVELQEMAMAEKPIVVDVELSKMPRAELKFDSFAAPMGPSAPLQSITLTENPSIPQKVDYLVSDHDAKSTTALQELYKKDFQVSYLHKILSAGLLGVKKNRKFVPTRWAITAVDSNLSQHLINQIQMQPQISEVELYHSQELKNDFWVMLFPAEWQFEQLEAWQPGSSWAAYEKEPTIMSDHEFHNGRKTYADEVAGAYYAARLAAAENLIERKRQAGCIVFREIGTDYNIPLGVWQIRENVRNALSGKPLTFSTTQLALEFLGTRLAIPIKHYKAKSALLDYAMHQRKLSEWLQ